MAIINGTKFDDTLPGTAGNDLIDGAAGNDTIDGGTGNDLILGGLGADIIQLGDGNDRFQWSQPDWSDVIEGGTGFDTGMDIGIAANQTISVSIQGGLLRLVDWIGIGGPIVTLNDVERLEITPIGRCRQHLHLRHERLRPPAGRHRSRIDRRRQDGRYQERLLSTCLGPACSDNEHLRHHRPAARSRSMAWPVACRPSIMSARPT